MKSEPASFAVGDTKSSTCHLDESHDQPHMKVSELAMIGSFALPALTSPVAYRLS